jgi:hypothetical protein
MLLTLYAADISVTNVCCLSSQTDSYFGNVGDMLGDMSPTCLRHVACRQIWALEMTFKNPTFPAKPRR